MRVDSGVAAGNEVSGVYDPMIAKLIVHGVDREHARRRMLRALDEFVIGGPKTLLGFHKALLEHECFVRGETCHGLVESEELAARAAELDGADAQPVSQRRTGARSSACARSRSTAGASRCACSSPSSRGASSRARRARARARGGGGAGSDAIVSPMQGTVLSVPSPTATRSRPGQVLCIVEAMKMENEVRAPHGGVVAQLSVAAGGPSRPARSSACSKRLDRALVRAEAPRREERRDGDRREQEQRYTPLAPQWPPATIAFRAA